MRTTVLLGLAALVGVASCGGYGAQAYGMGGGGGGYGRPSYGNGYNNGGGFNSYGNGGGFGGNNYNNGPPPFDGGFNRPYGGGGGGYGRPQGCQWSSHTTRMPDHQETATFDMEENKFFSFKCFHFILTNHVCILLALSSQSFGSLHHTRK
ncbi:Protein CBG17278 [Caenorhabditis briggsae]|uniref:Protein CBG17278 n=1 Tax=Caenorhabditis briggsae TaxID=6238 RepID=A8XQR3_CAEBR|nr:Protein CBG17278 [Caenorhabditis briggsae]CAP34988.1 Protein CBG17278 [Caenorhabditis briggsae]